MVDTQRTANSLAAVWLSFGRRTSVAAGAAVALIALLNDVNLWMASLRGGLTLIGLRVLVRLTARALLWSTKQQAGVREAQSGNEVKP